MRRQGFPCLTLHQSGVSLDITENISTILLTIVYIGSELQAIESNSNCYKRTKKTLVDIRRFK
jgi:hypothetical protein